MKYIIKIPGLSFLLFAGMQLSAQKTRTEQRIPVTSPPERRVTTPASQSPAMDRTRPVNIPSRPSTVNTPEPRAKPVMQAESDRTPQPVRSSNTVRPSKPLQQNPIPQSEQTIEPGSVQKVKKNIEPITVSPVPATDNNNIPIDVQKPPKKTATPTTIVNSPLPAPATVTQPVNTNSGNNYSNYFHREYRRDYRGYGDSRYIFLKNRRYYRNYLLSWTRINYGGYPYFYDNGFYYSYYDVFYRPLFPPAGIYISSLPSGYYPFDLNSNNYYYYNGIFYRSHNNYFEVIDAPIGSIIPVLPAEAISVLINGERYFELNGTYFKELINYQGRNVYQVVGKYGELNY